MVMENNSRFGLGYGGNLSDSKAIGRWKDEKTGGR